MKRENFESIRQIPETTEKTNELSTNNDKNVNNTVVNSNATPPNNEKITHKIYYQIR